MKELVTLYTAILPTEGKQRSGEHKYDALNYELIFHPAYDENDTEGLVLHVHAYNTREKLRIMGSLYPSAFVVMCEKMKVTEEDRTSFIQLCKDKLPSLHEQVKSIPYAFERTVTNIVEQIIYNSKLC